jgi:DnaD/phage-associated family protein
MKYKLAKQTGDTLAVPQLVFAKLPELEDDWLRVALLVISTGETNPTAIARTLHLKSPEKAREALLFWKGAGLLEGAMDEDIPPAAGSLNDAPPPRRRMNAQEVSAAAENDPAVAALLQECQRLMGGVIPPGDANIFASMYLADEMPVDMILLGVAHFVSKGKRSARYIERALLGWQAEGIDTGEATERYLHRLEQRAIYEQQAARLFNLPDAKFTKAERSLIVTWYEEFGYDDAMIAEAIAYAGEKKNPRYVNGILRAWYTKGLRTVRDVIAQSADTMQNIQVDNPHAKPILGNAPRRAPTFKK